MFSLLNDAVFFDDSGVAALKLINKIKLGEKASALIGSSDDILAGIANAQHLKSRGVTADFSLFGRQITDLFRVRAFSSD